MWETLRRRRAELDLWLLERGLAWRFSLATWLLHGETLPLLAAHARGRCLDAGAGRSPWRQRLLAQGAHVVSLDVEARGPGVDLVADLQRMPQVPSDSFDTVLCTQVLEHLPRPGEALAEIARVLRPGGALILSAPHLSMLHELPHDYFRFTREGLRVLLEAAGLRVEEIRPSGGLVAFLGHLASLALLSSLGAVPGLRRAVWALDQLLLVYLLAPLDRALGLRSLLPCNHVALARRPGVEPG